MGPSGHPENVLVKLKPLSLNGCLKARGCFSISQTGVSTLRKLEMAAIKVEGLFMAGIKNQEADLDAATDEGCPAGGNNPNKDEVTWGISVETAELLIPPTIFSTFVTPTHPTGLKVLFFFVFMPVSKPQGSLCSQMPSLWRQRWWQFQFFRCWGPFLHDFCLIFSCWGWLQKGKVFIMFGCLEIASERLSVIDFWAGSGS